MILGYISNHEELNEKYGVKKASDAELFSHLRYRYGEEAINELDGIFLALVVDEKRKKAEMFQSRFGFRLPFYMYQNSEGFAAGTEFAEVLEKTKSRKLNTEAAKDFIYFENIIPHEETLVQDIAKLTPNKCIVFDLKKGNLKVEPFAYSRKRRFHLLSAGKNLVVSIKENLFRIKNLLKKKELPVTFTSGWDSNLMMHELSKKDSSLAVTVGGEGGTGEIIQAGEILKKNYPHAEHLKDEITTDVFFEMKDIVSRTGGYFFQEGIFLRLILGKLLAENNLKFVFLGSAADQILFPETVGRKISRKLKRLFFRTSNEMSSEEKNIRSKIRSKNPKKSQFYIKLDYNIKMHQLLLGSFSVEGFFPFVNNKTDSIARTLGVLNYKKRLYKKFLRKYLPVGVVSYLQKSGSVVDTYKIYKAHKKELLKVLKSREIKKILDDHILKQIKKDPDNCHLLILQLNYIDSFCKLFRVN